MASDPRNLVESITLPSHHNRGAAPKSDDIDDAKAKYKQELDAPQDPNQALRKLHETKDPAEKAELSDYISIKARLTANQLAICVIALSLVIFIPTYASLILAINSFNLDEIDSYLFVSLTKQQFMNILNVFIIIVIGLPVIYIKRESILRHRNVLAVILISLAFLVCFIIPIYLFSHLFFN